MNLLLITASSEKIKYIRKSRVIGFQQVTMPYLASLTPSSWTVYHVDEECEKIDYNIDVDLVGITFHTPSANHAYSISEVFRKKGTPVVLGGPHTTLIPDEAQKHADSIVIGEADDIWTQLLDDFVRGELKKFYRQEKISSLENRPFSRKDLFHRRDMSNGILVATRGCPNKCEFCSLSVMYSNVFRKRPVDDVAREYASFRGKVVIFWDDNITADLKYAKQLFKAITPYKKWWSSQASIHAGSDDELLELAAKSGCKQLFIGIESVSQNSLNYVNKSFNRVDEYYKIINKIHSYGISVQVGIVFGFDHDNIDIFSQTMDFLESAGIQNATFNILTPYPGTPLFHRLESEGRILTYDWDKYNGRTDVVFEPKNMSREQLLDGFNMVNKQFYSLKSITKRLVKSPAGLWWTLPLNMAYHLSYKLFKDKTTSE
ncbi:MAG: radical SAM protein [Bacillota bacterium]|nr:radical SAM protein [Bacillota bacterium]